MRPHTDILIVGAGPAGLTAGYLLSKAGRDVHVIERDPRYVGGISRTVDYKGYLFDIGGHRFFSKSKRGGRPLGRDSCPTTSSSGRACRASSIGGKFYSPTR